MKKLKKLTLNEMQEFTPITQQEQIAMKGGTGWLWYKAFTIAYGITKGIYEFCGGSGSTGQGASSNGPSGSGGDFNMKVYGPDSVIHTNGSTKIYYPDSLEISY